MTGEQLCEVQGLVWDQLGREEEQGSGDLVAAVSLECLSSALGEQSRGNREYLATCWSAVVRAACCPVSVARLWRSEAVVDKAEVVLVGFDKEEADVWDHQDSR